MTRRKSHLNLTRLDDRLAPSATPGLTILPNPDYWRESKFNPSATAPAAEGGTWVVGTTQTAGRYYWFGPYNNDWAIAKLTATGNIDPTINNGQVKDLNAGLLDWFSILDIKAGPDGKLYALGRNISRDVYALAADPIAASISPSAPSLLTSARPLAIDSLSLPTLGTLASTASSVLPAAVAAPNEEFALVRFNADGSFDSSFDTDGIKLFDLNEHTLEYGFAGTDARLAVTADGRAVVATVQNSYSVSASTSTLELARFTTLGQFDSSFSGDGKTELPLSLTNRENIANSSQLLGMSLTSNGGIILGGSIGVYPNYSGDVANPPSPHNGLFVAKLTASGAADTSFDGDGFATVDFKTAKSFYNGGFIYLGSASDFTVTTSGQPLFIGTKSPGFILDTTDSYSNRAFVLRMSRDGQMDTSFDGEGVLSPNFSSELSVTEGLKISALPNNGWPEVVTVKSLADPK